MKWAFQGRLRPWSNLLTIEECIKDMDSYQEKSPSSQVVMEMVGQEQQSFGNIGKAILSLADQVGGEADAEVQRIIERQRLMKAVADAGFVGFTRYDAREGLSLFHADEILTDISYQCEKGGVELWREWLKEQKQKVDASRMKNSACASLIFPVIGT